MIERWAPIAGFEGRYEVSDHGRVRSLRLIKGGVDKLRDAPLILKTARRRGYPSVNLSTKSKPHMQTTHTLVALTFIGPRPEGHQIRHLDGNKDNPALDNLAYGTPTENEADKERHGTKLKGAACGAAKLNDDTVLAILGAYRFGSTEAGSVALGRRFDISPTNISDIVNGNIWKHIDRSAFPNLKVPAPKPPKVARVIPPSDCLVCGSLFQGRGHRRDAKTCSPACLSALLSQRTTEAWRMRSGPLFGGKE